MNLSLEGIDFNIRDFEDSDEKLKLYFRNL